MCGKVRRQNSCIERHEDRVHTSVLNIQLLLQQLTLSSQHVTVPSSAEQSIGKDAILTTTRTSQQDVSFRQHRDNCQHNKQRKWALFWQSEIKARTRTRCAKRPERCNYEVKSEGENFFFQGFSSMMELQEYITGQVRDRSKFCGIAKRTIRLSFMPPPSLCWGGKWSCPKDSIFVPYLHNKLVACIPQAIKSIFWSITIPSQCFFIDRHVYWDKRA